MNHSLQTISIRPISIILVLILAAWTILGCSSAPAGVPASDAAMSEPAPVEEMSASDNESIQLVSNEQGTDPQRTTDLGQRKIIREATIRIEASDITTALNQATSLSVRIGGYTTGSNAWRDESNRPYANLSFAVPVERFEEALEHSRRLGNVTEEHVTSQDVTAQYVDLEARIKNLEVTSERVRVILAEAKELKYVLEINRELSRIESDLESLKGQRNALAQKTSFSIIHLDLVPTPIQQTTGEVLEEVSVWSPMATFNAALSVLLDVTQVGITAFIWLIVVGGPIIIITGLLWIVLRWILGRVGRSQVMKVTNQPQVITNQ
ncbi:MAG: DUF4349 domain-containing protein [Chloroflexota bacterium]